NVRELRNAVERSMILSAGEEITLQDLPDEIRRGTASNHASRENSFFTSPGFRDARRNFEVAFLRRKLEENHWNVSRTAAEIGLHRQSLQEKLRELGIQRPGK
ncbi:MAG TPA: helix-turn-helix domain-containing protein, partial [Candidatus Acidoferrales bacterium]